MNVLCPREEESVDHPFVHCALVHEVWSFFLSYLNTYWSFPFQFSELILRWWIRDLDSLPTILWSSLPGAICWGIWKERNSRIFEDNLMSYEEILSYIHSTLFDWISIRSDFEEREWVSIWCEHGSKC